MKSDQNLPASWSGELFQNRFEDGNSAGTRSAPSHPAHDFEPGLGAAGYEPVGLDWHPLKGDLKGHWAVTVNKNWRLIFSFEGEDAILVDYRDYH